MKKAVIIFRLILIVCFISLPALVMAQTAPPFNDDVDDVPFDGGITLLVAAGIGYGLKKAHEKKNAVKL